MTTEHIVRTAAQRPFEPFTMRLVDGRSVTLRSADHIALGRAALTAVVTYDNGQSEVIDTGLIVSLQTISAAPAAFLETEAEA